MIVFYDHLDIAQAYTENAVDIYSFNGEPLAYFYMDAIYSYQGKQLGWFSDGWIRDLNGFCVFFTQGATGGPLKSLIHPIPFVGTKRLLPIKAPRQIMKIRPIKRLTWSPLSNQHFFKQ